MTRSELKALTRVRLQEATALFNAGFYDGCVYLCGYTLELALKARICRLLQISTYPEKDSFKQAYKTHDFSTLKTLAGLDSKLTVSNPQLFANWSHVTSWKPDFRYRNPGSVNQAQAQQFLNSLNEKPNGVLTWLMKRW